MPENTKNAQNSNHNQAILINGASLKTNFQQDILKSADVYIDNKQIDKQIDQNFKITFS